MKKYFNKRYVFVFRFFSGLKSVRNREWIPCGSPAIYKILESVNEREINSEVILLCKTPHESERISRVTHVKLAELRYIDFTIVPFYSFTRIKRIDYILNGCLHFLFTAKYVISHKPCILYCDRINMYIGAFFSLFKKPKVILRLLGVLDYMEFYQKKINALRYPLKYFSMRAPFSYIICTRDGSPAELFLSNYANKASPYLVLLNGIDKQISSSLNQNFFKKRNKIKILFVGKFGEDKGILELIEAIKIVKNQGCDNFSAIVLGDGYLKEKVNRMLQSYDLKDSIELKGTLPHSDIYDYYKKADIYISLNKRGNLSNTVLEALACGCCLIILGKNKNGVDEDTESLIPDDCAKKISRDHIKEDLSGKLISLLNNPAQIEEYRKRAQCLAQKILVGWEERLNMEVNILEKLATSA